MGRFSTQFEKAATHASKYLTGSLYERYYSTQSPSKRTMFKSKPSLAKQCEKRAGVVSGWGGSVAKNGMIIEQQQVLTTHNLAILFDTLDLKHHLHAHLPKMITDCFESVCQLLQLKSDSYHTNLIHTKQAAYAWRQMMFFMSEMSKDEQLKCMQSICHHFLLQAETFQHKFSPVIEGLESALVKQPLKENQENKIFYGWSDSTHWLIH